MPLISVVVPVYNVQRYLAECLESLAQQTHRDLEVIVVDDGATDRSAEVAQRFVDRDERFHLVSQPNGGLGNARNTGADRATGEYLAFVDSDDVVVGNAYERLVGALQETGSDFATGNYHRLTHTGTWQSAMVAGTFTANRLKTHVSKHPALLNDRTAWNKLFRRSFWDLHEFRWPEGVLYEDIPVTLPAHVLARSVDVLRQPVYLWRARVGDSSSITQRRTEPRAIRDRTSAVDGVSRFLAEQGEDKLKVLYDRSVAEQDLRYFLAPLDSAGDEFRSLFLDLVNDFFDRAAPDVFDPLPAIHRLEWHLVRRRLLPEVLEVLRFERSGEINRTPVIRKGRRFWGNYPFRGDPSLAIPDDVYRLTREELPVRAAIEDVSWQGDELHLTGWAYIAFMDLSREGSSRIRMTLEESGHPENVVSLSVRTVRRPDVTEAAPDGVTNYDWCGFEASVPVSALAPRGGFRTGHWRLRVEIRSQGITRLRWLARTEPGRATRPPLKIVDGTRVVPTSEVGDFAVQISTQPAEVTEVRRDDDVLELTGVLHGREIDPAVSRLRLSRVDGAATVLLPAAPAGPPGSDGHPFVARLPLEALRTLHGVGDSVSGAEDRGNGIEWDVALRPDDSPRHAQLVVTPGLPEPRLTLGSSEFAVRSTRTGRFRVVERHFRPEVESVRWADEDWLELEGSYHEPTGADAVLQLAEPLRGELHEVPMSRDGSRFVARLRPGAMTTQAGEMPLAEGKWELYLRPHQRGNPVRVKLDRALLPSLPVTRDVGRREMTVVDVDYDSLSIQSGRELPPSEVGRAARTRMQTREYPALLRRGATDQVFVDAYANGQYAGDAKAVVEELSRRGSDLPVVWSVVDGQAAVPAGITPVARYSRAWFEALATSRYVVASDVLGVPELEKPGHQRMLQTWHGIPVRPLGLDDPASGGRLGTGWEDRARQEAARWDVLLSSGPAGSAVLRRAFGDALPVLESGLPRHDLLRSEAGLEAARRVREGLQLPEDRAVVLYAPGYLADQPFMPARPGQSDRYRFELDLDLDVVRELLGDDHVLLVRPHPKSVGSVTDADGVDVVDASRWADSRDLLLAADVVVSDRSSIMLDAAVAGRPVVRWAPGQVTRDDQVPEGYPDLDALVTASAATAEELCTAVRAVGDARDDQGRRPTGSPLVETWAPLVDGAAAARAVDALLSD